MEFLKVTVPGWDADHIDVFLNGKKNGKVGSVLLVGKGYVRISADMVGAQDMRVNVTGTTATKPYIAKIKVIE
jgi:hypothetical protein